MPRLVEFFYTAQTAPLAEQYLRKHNIPALQVRIRGKQEAYGLRVPDENAAQANQLLAHAPSFTGQPLALLKPKARPARLPVGLALLVIAIALCIGAYGIITNN